MTTFTISHVEGGGAFEALKADWERLWHVSEDATDSQLWAWQVAYWRLLDPRSTPVVIVARDQAKNCIALSSFALSRDKRLLVRKATFLGDNTPDYHVVLRDPAVPAAVESTMFRYARDYLRSKGSFLELSNVPASSYSGRALSEFLQGVPVSANIVAWETETFSVPLPNTLDEYLDTLGSRSRRDFSYDRRRLKRDFEIDLRACSDPGRLADALDAIEHIDRARWGGDSRYNNPSFRRFVHAVSAHLCDNGMYRAFLLYADKRPVAYVSGAVVRNELKLHAMAHDRSFPAKYSVGKVANFLAIEASIQEGLSAYDLSRGGESYKKWLGGKERTNLHYREYRSRLDSAMLTGAQRLSGSIRENRYLRRGYQHARRLRS